MDATSNEQLDERIAKRKRQNVERVLLAAFATAWALHKRAAHEIAKPGFAFVVKSKRGAPSANAWVRLLNQQAALVASLGDRLGLDPKSRAALA
jgi:phage terminase small subunit